MTIFHIWREVTALLQRLDFTTLHSIVPLSFDDGLLRIGTTCALPELNELLEHLPAMLGKTSLRRIKIEFISDQTHARLSRIYRQDIGEIDGTFTAERLGPWLGSTSGIRSILYLQTSKSYECLDEVLAILGLSGYDTRLGNLKVVSGDRVEAANSSKQLQEAELLIIVGLAEVSQADSILSVIEDRVDAGSRTIIVDHTPPIWMKPTRARMRVLAAATECSVAVQSDAAESTAGTNESDQEIIRVAARYVAKHFEVSAESLFDRRSDMSTLKARQAAVYVAREWGKFDFATIGHTLGDRTYVSAAQAYRRMADRRVYDKELDSLLTAVISELEGLSKGTLK